MLLYNWGFFIQPGRHEEFVAWLEANDARLVELAPRNYEYLGTYRSLSPEPQDFHQIWRYRSEAQPDMRRAAADEAGAFTEIAREYLSFVDADRQDEEAFRLYREVAQP
jgi:hypothetical protein